MSFTLKRSLISLLLVLTIGLSGWSLFLSTKSKVVITENFDDQPDVFMEEVVAMVMDKLGNPTMKIETPKMIHYPQNDTTELLSPHVVVFRDTPQPWHITAKHAKTTQGVSEITFWDDVVIHHLADSANPLTTMHTSTLTIFPDQKVASTKEAIIVNQPDATVHAVGMLANWEDGTVKLLSQAREEYVPK